MTPAPLVHVSGPLLLPSMMVFAFTQKSSSSEKVAAVVFLLFNGSFFFSHFNPMWGLFLSTLSFLAARLLKHIIVKHQWTMDHLWKKAKSVHKQVAGYFRPPLPKTQETRLRRTSRSSTTIQSLENPINGLRLPNMPTYYQQPKRRRSRERFLSN